MSFNRINLPALLGLFLFAASPLVALSQEAPPEDFPVLAERLPMEPMTVDRLDTIVRMIDPQAKRMGSVLSFQFVTEDALVVSGQIITDTNADRMRIVVGIGEESSLSSDLMKRAMQANFDSALDARYAIAQGFIWSTFIHPLSPLEDEQFLSGLSQTITAAMTFGTSFSSGAFVFGGGDSEGIMDDLLEKYKRRNKPGI